MSNIKFNFRIKYESEKAAEEMKKALTQLRSLPIREIRVAGTRGADGGIEAGEADGAVRDGGAVGTGGAGRLDAAIERFGSLSQWIGGAEGGIGAGREGGDAGDAGDAGDSGDGGDGAAGAAGAAGGAGRLDSAIESTIARFGSLFQWIE